MNIYELDEMIESLVEESSEINIPIITFYQKKRIELVSQIKTNINKELSLI